MSNIQFNPTDLLGIAIAALIVFIGFRLAPKNVSVAGHDAGQLFLLAALPLFFIDFATSAEYAAGEMHKILSESGLQYYAGYAVLVVALFNLLFGGLYIYALGVFRDGGGASTAAFRYLGPTVAITVAFLLLEDYILTVVVSSLSGADQLLSTIGALESAGPIVHIVLGIIIAFFTCWLTLRGRRDAAKITFVVLWTYTVLMVITFASLAIRSSQNLPPPTAIANYRIAAIPVPGADVPLSEIFGVIANSVLHGLVALTGLEAVSNGLPFIKNDDANFVKWGKKKLPGLKGLWAFYSGRVGVGRTIQTGFLFFGAFTLAFNSHFSNVYGVIDTSNGMTLVGNLAYLGLVPIGGYVLFFFRQIWSALTLSFANMTAYEDMQSTAYRDGVQGLLPIGLVYRSPNGNFPRPVLMTFGIATAIIILVGGNTSLAIPFYGIGVFAPIGFMGFAVTRHLQQTKPRGYRFGVIFSFLAGVTSLTVFVSQIVSKFSEGGWIRLFTFGSLFTMGHFILLSKNGERFDKMATYFIYSVSRMQGTMAELLTWQTHMLQTYRSNLWARLTHWHTGDERPLILAHYPEYMAHYDHDDHHQHHDSGMAMPGAEAPVVAAAQPAKPENIR